MEKFKERRGNLKNQNPYNLCDSHSIVQSTNLAQNLKSILQYTVKFTYNLREFKNTTTVSLIHKFIKRNSSASFIILIIILHFVLSPNEQIRLLNSKELPKSKNCFLKK